MRGKNFERRGGGEGVLGVQRNMLRGGGRGETIGQGCRVTVGSGKEDEDAGEGNGGGGGRGCIGLR